ncbi:MAG: NAD(P)-dependent oxidoreductase [Pseudomonadaceae bacterium]|nr:NAD(P)-dependent oxidoreductase [Pseudomonadaceae bacterium]
MNISFLGLGVMGYPMAGYLAKAGHNVTVYNRTAGKAEAWANEYGGATAATPAAAAQNADVLISMVGNDDDVRQVLIASGALAALPEGALLIDHTTASATLAQQLATLCDQHGHAFVDAPVSGGQKGAVEGILTIMAGGTPQAFARAEPVFQAYAKTITHVGPAGHGQLCKMLNQICIAGVLAGVAEAVHLGQKSGLDMQKAYQAIKGGSAQSWQFDNRVPTMLDDKYDFGFAVEWLRKDLGIAISQAKSVGAALPATALVDQFLAEVEAMGGKRWDGSSLLKRYRR